MLVPASAPAMGCGEIPRVPHDNGPHCISGSDADGWRLDRGYCCARLTGCLEIWQKLAASPPPNSALSRKMTKRSTASRRLLGRAGARCLRRGLLGLSLLVQLLHDGTFAVAVSFALEPVVDGGEHHVRLRKLWALLDQSLQFRTSLVGPPHGEMHGGDLKAHARVPRPRV